MNVRSFPEGERKCYTLRPEQGKDNKYLIRAQFFYGNYYSKNQFPEFKLYLGTDEWDTVNIGNSSTVIWKEIIHAPKTNDIDVCLVNIDSGTPFISVLELRPLNNSIYEKTEPGSLLFYNRLDFGAEQDSKIREKDDVFDRIWNPSRWGYWASINASYGSYSLSTSEYRLPRTVMETAATPANESEFLRFSLNISGDPSQKFYIYTHFAEVEELNEGELREFTISLNDDESWGGGAFTPSYMSSATLSSINSASGSTANKMLFTMKKTGRSTRPPIINAMEVYSIKDFSQSSTLQGDVDAIKKIKSVYRMSRNWQGDPCLPESYQWTGLSCSKSGSPSIISLNLSSSNLTGKIDSSFSTLTSLQYLDLSYNNLTGEIPDYLAELTSLNSLNLSGNNFTGSVPLALLRKSDNESLSLSLDGNPYLCKTNSCAEEEEKQKKKGRNITVPVVASIASVLLLLAALATLWRFKIRRQHEKKVLDSKNQCFSYSEVVSITDNFQKVLGKGGLGAVYSGHLKDGTQVAVKMLSPSSAQGSKQFRTEAQLLARVHHRNLASLVGCCDEGSNMGLIYEYMANGNLEELLSGKNAPVLSWEQRLRIAIDAAQALEYLHNGCKPPIIHRDVKTANILLNEKPQAKVRDFGIDGKKKKNLTVPIVSSAVSVLVLSDIVVKPNGQEEKIVGQNNRRLCYSDIASITDNFQKVIGKGGFGKVYSGHLSDGTQVAVKMLSSPSTHGSKQCWTEAQLLTRVHHRNLVSLLGYCDEGPNMGLMYEYMANGNLQEYLSGTVKDASVLTWEQRLRIAIDAAQALEYLHNGCKPPIIHRDVKTANILLDEKLQAKVADFGLSRCLPPENGNSLSGDYLSTAVAGTPGYLDPEYYTTSRLNEKSDVYSFGIVLLELITGQPPVIKQGEKSVLHIVQWVSPIIESGEIRDIVDQRLHGDFDISSVRKAIDTAMACVTYSSTTRPTMSHVLLELKGCLNIEIARERSGDNSFTTLTHILCFDASLDGNPYLCKTNSCAEEEEKQKKKGTNITVPVGAAIASVLLLLAALATLWRFNIRRQHEKKVLDSKNQCFSYSEVVSITDNFQQVLGKGGFGAVYSGHLKDGTQVAVKMLSPSSAQGSKQFWTEVELLARVHHRNLASLVEYCDEGSNMGLIYEYMANGNLEELLSGKNAPVLSWEQRLRIAIDAAQALEYLHNGCKPPIIHRDVKTANILLNEKLQARVGDFGMSRIIPFESETHVSTAVVGTLGYYITGRLNEKSDVYSFGIVLLELISGKPAIIGSHGNKDHIVQWVGPIISRGEIRSIVDPRLEGDFNTNSVWKSVETAMACVPSISIQRPTMSEVVGELKECLNIEIRDEELIV
ncbi:hypothetical protein PVL29_011301 [Vitis rotundifolia]|uniref:non-specific serine/threonine protein kinase n=1 Tax=Vitis rotundifolia TaxID=103349 RepID=A0AA38ZN56_VITRO|nr:hypothetical protein PVL29_011301 [Vitis rotundifolia]